MEFYSRKGTSAIVEKLFSIQNASIRPIVRNLHVKVNRSYEKAIDDAYLEMLTVAACMQF